MPGNYNIPSPTPGGRGSGWVGDPVMQGIMRMYLDQFNQMPDYQSFLQQRMVPIQDQLARGAVQSRKNAASNISSRGMLGSGAYPAALGMIEQGRLGAEGRGRGKRGQRVVARQLGRLRGMMTAGQGAFVPSSPYGPDPGFDWGGLAKSFGQMGTDLAMIAMLT